MSGRYSALLNWKGKEAADGFAQLRVIGAAGGGFGVGFCKDGR